MVVSRLNRNDTAGDALGSSACRWLSVTSRTSRRVGATASWATFQARPPSCRERRMTGRERGALSRKSEAAHRRAHRPVLHPERTRKRMSHFRRDRFAPVGLVRAGLDRVPRPEPRSRWSTPPSIASFVFPAETAREDGLKTGIAGPGRSSRFSFSISQGRCTRFPACAAASFTENATRRTYRAPSHRLRRPPGVSERCVPFGMG